MDIKILGPGCAKCVKLYEITAEAARETGVPANIEKITGIAEIASYGVMSTPALVIDGQVAMMGRVPSKEQVKMLLTVRGKK